MESEFKRELRRDHPQRTDNLFQPFWSNDQKRLCPFRISHCQEHARQSADMVCMKVRKTDHINRLWAPALLLHCDLRTLSAVDQYTLSVIARHHCCQIAVRKWHHSARSQQTNIYHLLSSTLILPATQILPSPSQGSQKSLSAYHSRLHTDQSCVSHHLYAKNIQSSAVLHTQLPSAFRFPS